MENEEITEVEEKVITDAETLKPKPPTRFAPRGIETFTVCRQSDESGVSALVSSLRACSSPPDRLFCIG